MAEQIVIAELQINTKSLQDSSTQLIQEIAKLKAEQKDLQKETNNLANATEEQSRQFIENDATLKRLNAEYQNNKKVLAEAQTGIAGLNDELSKEVNTISQAEQANKRLSIIRSQITTDTQAGRDAIEQINQRINENNDFINENSDKLKQQKINIGNYQESIKGALGELNIFNGGLGGFIARSQEAGGTGNLLKGAFSGISQGVIAATKASLGFIATPLGAVIAAIALVLGGLYAIFKSFTPVVDKAEQAMAAIGAVFNVVKNAAIALFTGTKSLTEAFGNLGGSMADAADQAMALKKAQQDLEDQQGSLEIQEAKSTRQINEYLLKSKDRTLSEKERIEYLQKAQETEKALYNERKKVADEELKQAQDKLIIGTGLTNEEIKQLKQKGFAYAKVLQDKYALDDEDIDKLKDALIKKENILNDSVAIQEKAQNKVNALYEKADADREKAEAKAASDRDKAVQKQNEAKDKKIQFMNDELALFIAKENIKTKTVEQSIQFEQDMSKKRLAILDKEYEFGKISKQKYEEQKILIEFESAKRQAQLSVDNLSQELKLWELQNKSKIASNQQLTDEIVADEVKRQEHIFDENNKSLEKQHDAGLISEAQYQIQKLELVDSFESQKKAIEDNYAAQKKAQQDEQRAIDFQEKLTTLESQNATEYELKLAQEQAQYENDIANLEERKKQGAISEENYQKVLATINRKYAKIKADVSIAAEQAKLKGAAQVAQGISQLVGQETVVGKAAAVAQASINTYQGATLALATLPPPFGEIAAGITIASGFAQVAKIAGLEGAESVASGLGSVASGVGEIGKAQLPTAEKGALFEIGGNRHYAGGTKFVGEDGTAFEAEQGELIGVMNRNASRAFMEFNNSYPSGASVSRPNVFATGGFVNQSASNGARVDLDYSLLAAKIGENVAMANAKLPPPVVYTAIADINTGQHNYAQVVSGANHG